MQLIDRYFPGLSPEQKDIYGRMEEAYCRWNSMINVISRKDIGNFYEHHVLHSLAIAKIVNFPAGSTVLDIGTGGGFPGIPLAVMFPECSFTLCDSIGKKVMVAQSVAQELGIENVRCVHCRAEELDREFDFVVSRAVTSLDIFYPWTENLVKGSIFYLKGGELEDEIRQCCSKCHISRDRFLVTDISSFFKEEFFETKKIVTITK